MKKIILLTFVLTVIAGTAVFANGEQEGSFDDAVRPWRGEEFDGEIISLTGSLKLEEGEFPSLIADGEEYELMYPHFLDDGIELSDGQPVTVEGFLVPGPRWETEGEELHLRVTKAVIDGEEYDLEAYGPGFGPMMGGSYGGPRGGFAGRGYSDDCPYCDDGNYGRGSYGGRRGGMMGGRPGGFGNSFPRGRR